MVSEEDVRRVALSMPGSFERPSYGGRPAWRTKARMFAWIREDPEALVIWVDTEDDKEALVAAAPDTFFTTPHYDGAAVVLARLEALDVEELTELVTDSWRARS